MAESGRAEIALPAKVEAESLVEQDKQDTEPNHESRTETAEPSEEGPSEGPDILDRSDKEKYLWYRCDCDPTRYHGQQHYWLNTETKESRWDEPSEPYWIWNATTQDADEAGLQQPSTSE